jgi:hypothetical protein
MLSGPGTVAFGNSLKPRTDATFSQAGLYTLRLTASDGQLTSTDDVQVRIWPQNLTGERFNLPGIIQAENYHTYHNTNGYGDVIYRNHPVSPVDVFLADKEVNNYAVSDLWPGEWLAYDVDITQPGDYLLNLRAAAASSNGQVHLEIDGQNISGPITFSSRIGNYEDFQTYTKTVTLNTTGHHTLKLIADSPSNLGSQLNVVINYLEFIPNSVPPLPGDFNVDGVVDSRDFFAFLPHFNELNGNVKLVGSGLVNLFDFNYLIKVMFK